MSWQVVRARVCDRRRSARRIAAGLAVLLNVCLILSGLGPLTSPRSEAFCSTKSAATASLLGSVAQTEAAREMWSPHELLTRALRHAAAIEEARNRHILFMAIAGFQC